MSDRPASLGTLRGAFEATGSPSWIMHTIQRRGLDRRHGFALDLQLGGDTLRHSMQATESLLAEGVVDLIDTDWLSIARMRREGVPVQAVFPYGRIMGGIAVPAESPVHRLEEIRGRRIGVVRKLDKNWLVVRAACLREHGFDPQAEATVVEAKSKTVLLDWLEKGEVEVDVLYWHLLPRLTSSGRFRQLYDVLDLVHALSGVNPPTTFFVCHEDFIAQKGALVQAFVAAYCEAVALMRADTGSWMEALAPVAGSDTALADGLRASWNRRICTSWAAEDQCALDELFRRLKEIGGSEAVGGIEAIPPEIFAAAWTN